MKQISKQIWRELEILQREKGHLTAEDVTMTFQAHGIKEIPIEVLATYCGGSCPVQSDIVVFGYSDAFKPT